jgi:hypothetical protein
MIVALPPVPAGVTFPTEAWQFADPPAGALRRGLPALVEQEQRQDSPHPRLRGGYGDLRVACDHGGFEHVKVVFEEPPKT